MQKEHMSYLFLANMSCTNLSSLPVQFEVSKVYEKREYLISIFRQNIFYTIKLFESLSLIQSGPEKPNTGLKSFSL